MAKYYEQISLWFEKKIFLKKQHIQMYLLRSDKIFFPDTHAN